MSQLNDLKTQEVILQNQEGKKFGITRPQYTYRFPPVNAESRDFYKAPFPKEEKNK